jgi:hypothetical protein
MKNKKKMVHDESFASSDQRDEAYQSKNMILSETKSLTK